ncbi:efflux RND transporter periplasmic adaptor subunit [Lachnospiraceae bacterium C1.1]|nr:efflux RND transporter periplasmic adaptor subunit [Lachnospiraceae bacterium C1.1]
MIMKKYLKYIVITLIVIALVAGGLFYFFMPKSVNVVTPAKGNVSPYINVSGKIEGSKKITVYSNVSGIIDERFIEEGIRVKKGDRLFSFINEIQETELDQAQTNQEYADKILGSVNTDRAQIKNKLAQVNLEIENCEKTYAFLEAKMLAMKDENYKKDYNLGKRMETADEDEAGALLSQTGMNPDTYKKYIVLQNNLETVSRLWNDAKAKKEILEAQLSANKNSLTEEQQLEQVKKEVNKAENEIQKLNSGSVAPADGIITGCLVDSGAFVEKGTALLEMQSVDAYRVKLMVSKYDISSVEIGQKASIRIGSDKYEGEVVLIKQSAEEDAVGKSRVAIEVSIDTDDELIVGLDADVTIELANAENVTVVSNDLIYTDDNGSYLYIVEDGEVAKRYIETGIKDDSSTEVLDVDENLHIITDPDAADYLGESVAEEL